MDKEIKLDKNCLAFILDVANKERVDNQTFNNCGYIIKIDHHKPFDEPFEDLTWVDTNYSSCSEMILDLYSLKSLTINKYIPIDCFILMSHNSCTNCITSYIYCSSCHIQNSINSHDHSNRLNWKSY